MRSARGQASVEVVAMVPLLLAVVLGVAQLLAAGAARELAGHAAEAGAAAILQGGGDPAQAARASLPGWSRDRVSVRVTGRRVRVRLRPRALLPGTASRLVAVAVADAGPGG